MGRRTVHFIWSFLVFPIFAFPAVAQDAAPAPAKAKAGWLESDLPAGTIFVASDNGRFKSCKAPPGQDTSAFRKQCSAYLKANRLMRAMAPIGDTSKWVQQSDYPASAAAIGARGQSRIKVLVGPDGSTSHCEIEKSSGFDDLDQAGCAAILKRARFRPATDATGTPVAVTWSKTINWHTK